MTPQLLVLFLTIIGLLKVPPPPPPAAPTSSWLFPVGYGFPDCAPRHPVDGCLKEDGMIYGFVYVDSGREIYFIDTALYPGFEWVLSYSSEGRPLTIYTESYK